MLDLRYYRQRRSDGNGDLFRVPLRGGTAERVIGDVSGAAAVSPDSSLGYLTPDEFARQWRFVSPSYDPCRAAEQPCQGNPDGFRFASGLDPAAPLPGDL